MGERALKLALRHTRLEASKAIFESSRLVYDEMTPFEVTLPQANKPSQQWIVCFLFVLVRSRRSTTSCPNEDAKRAQPVRG